MDRELLIEIGCEEIPAGWLPGLTRQVGEQLDARLKEFRLNTDARTETYSTPRRLTARVAKLAERQEDFEELVTGPPVSAAFKPDGEATPAAAGFARKYNVDVGALERHQTPKGIYLAHRVHQRGKATVDVLADVMTALLRSLTFPKQMRWDAYLEDGKGDLVFARPIRWLVLLYGGRVVPFVIRRTEIAQGPTVQDIRSGSNTYGHRFLTTSGRAGRAVKVKTFDDYQARLLENFVILDRTEREQKIRRELETHARRLSGRVSTSVAHSSLLQEVPDLVEYPSVVAGHIPIEFLSLPEAVWKAIYFHYLPIGVEADAPPTRQQLGAAAITWAAVSLADKLDSVVGMFSAGERPTGSRDPLGLRRQAQGIVKILADLPELTGVDRRLPLGPLLARAAQPFTPDADVMSAVESFMSDRLSYLLEQRGFDVRNVRAVLHADIARTSPLEAKRKLEALAQMAGSPSLLGVATLLKRVKNISKGVAAPANNPNGLLTEPAEKALVAALETSAPAIRAAAERSDYREAFASVAALQPTVAKFFDDVLVMAEDERLRAARVGLVAMMRDLILEIADISEIVTGD